jgi:hypothetical protein
MWKRTPLIDRASYSTSKDRENSVFFLESVPMIFADCWETVRLTNSIFVTYGGCTLTRRTVRLEGLAWIIRVRSSLPDRRFRILFDVLRQMLAMLANQRLRRRAVPFPLSTKPVSPYVPLRETPMVDSSGRQPYLWRSRAESLLQGVYSAARFNTHYDETHIRGDPYGHRADRRDRGRPGCQPL